MRYLTRLSEWLQRNSSGKVIWGSLVVILLLIFVPILFGDDSSIEVVPLDTRFFYTPEEAFDTIEDYQQLDGVVQGYLTSDLLRPILYAILLGTSLSWVINRKFGLVSSYHQFNLLGPLVALLDILENFFIIGLYVTYPDKNYLLAWGSTICTTSKYLSVFASVILIMFWGITGKNQEDHLVVDDNM